MVTRLSTKDSTAVRQERERVCSALDSLSQQYDVIIDAIELEAIDAARTLGIETRSPKKLREMIKGEIWKNEYPNPDEAFEQCETAPPSWDRAVCLNLIDMLL